MVLISGMRAGQTMVPNAFIDRYLASGNGEYVKVYLMLLRLMEDRSQEVSVASLADRLDHTEKDVMRALSYWERQSLLELKYEDGQLQQVVLLDVSEEPENVPAGEPAVEEAAPTIVADAGKSLPPKRFDLQSVQEDEDFRQLVFLAETYLGRTLSVKDLEFLGYLYKELQFPADLIEYLIEYCVDRGHKSLKYMEAVALGWHAEGKNSVQQVKEANRAYTRENKKVMKAFGIQGRVLGAEEQRMVQTWIHEYGMPLELIVEACNRTMSAIHQPSFEYADKILSSWHKKGLTTLEAVQEASQQHRNEKKAQEKAAGKEMAPAQKGNRFHNFDQRTTDYDALLKKGIH